MGTVTLCTVHVLCRYVLLQLVILSDINITPSGVTSDRNGTPTCTTQYFTVLYITEFYLRISVHQTERVQCIEFRLYIYGMQQEQPTHMYHTQSIFIASPRIYIFIASPRIYIFIASPRIIDQLMQYIDDTMDDTHIVTRTFLAT
jgi:hypothetical protein